MSSEAGYYNLSQSEYGIFYECGEPTAAYNISYITPLEGLESGRMLTDQA